MIDALKQYGADAMSFPALKVGARWWTDAPPPAGTGARVAYVPSGRSWIAVGRPLTDPGAMAEAVQRFYAAARAERRRPVFFGVEDDEPFREGRLLLIGMQSMLKPAEWDATLRQRPRLREQLRRARAKGVTVRQVHQADLSEGSPLRHEVARLKQEWLASRHLEPMSFLVEVNPFYAASEHLYFIAERNSVAVQFLSAVPIYSRNGWLMEDMLRGRHAPNGTTELVIDALMRTLKSDPLWLTAGLTPLSGPIPAWLKVARAASVALYDFSGLRRFRERLRPSAWHPVWLAWDRGPAIGPILDVLSLFARGRLARFAIQSFIRHPNGPPWLVAVPLVAWTVLLGAITVAGRSAVLGFSTSQLAAWVVFDVVLAWLLFRGARKPRRRTLAMLAAIAGIDAILSLDHLSRVGFGSTVVTEVLRAIATLGPLVGTAALLWALWRAQAALSRAA